MTILVLSLQSLGNDNEMRRRGQLSHTMQALLHRAATGRPLGILKYAMTLDGKIATSSGHSAWVSCSESRALVFETRFAVLLGIFLLTINIF